MKSHVIENLVAQLNCLSRVATLEDAPRSQRLAKSLADVLRYRNTRQGQIVQGRSELETGSDGAWKLSIDVQARESLLELTVSDNGIGFDAHQSLAAPDETADYGTIASTAWRTRVDYR